jgi:hypothetical protein
VSAADEKEDVVDDPDTVDRIANALAHWRGVAKEALSEVERLEAENARIRAVLDAAIAVDRSPGYLEHQALHETLKAAGAR